jgi:DNA polymerase-3 subunit alpha
LTDEQRAVLATQIAEKEQKLFKSILGCEAYVARRSRLLKDKDNVEDRSGYHLILLAKNKKVYQNL